MAAVAAAVSTRYFVADPRDLFGRRRCFFKGGEGLVVLRPNPATLFLLAVVFATRSAESGSIFLRFFVKISPALFSLRFFVIFSIVPCLFIVAPSSSVCS